MISASVLRELAADLTRPRQVGSAVLAGLVAAVVFVVFCLSVTAAVFSGPLEAYFPRALGLLLFAFCVLGVLIGLGSGFRGAVGGPPIPSVMLLVAIWGTFELEGRVAYATMVITALIGTLGVGAAFLAVGHLRLARYLRFIPYPVAGGFIAGTGGLACLVSLRLMGLDLDPQALAATVAPGAHVDLAIGVVYGVALFVMLKRWKNYLLFPVSFAVVVVLVHLATSLLGVAADEAGVRGLAFSAPEAGGLWPPLGPADFAFIDWAAVAGHLYHLVVLFIVLLACVVIHLGAVEAATDTDQDWNREFTVNGWSNLVVGFGGAPPGCMLAPSTVRNVLFGATSRVTCLVTSLALAACLVGGVDLFRLVPLPLPLVAALLLCLGLQMLEAWLVDTVRRLAWTDYGIILAMFAALVLLGFFQGVAVGMVFTVLVFVLGLSRVDPVESRFTMRDRQSNRTRPVPERAILLAEGSHVQAYRLRGYLFFGSAYPLADQLKASLAAQPPPSCILLDFENVTSFDFSAVNAMVRFIRAADTEGVVVVLSGAPKRLEVVLEAELPPALYANLVREHDEDHALERCEEIVIEKWQSREESEGSSRDALLEQVVDDFARHLDRQVLFEEMLGELEVWLEPREFASGETIVASGEPRDGLQLLRQGRASQFDSNGTRLFELSPGAVIEPRGAFDASPAANATIAVEPCRTLVLAPDVRAKLEHNEPQLMLKLNAYTFTAPDRHSATA